MRSILSFIMIISICAFIISCGKISRDKNFTSCLINNSDSSIIDQTTNIISPLEEKDFSISDPKISIQLDSSFLNFKIDKPEKTADNTSFLSNFVGYVYSGDFVYKVFSHEYYDFILYVSNYNYNLKNRNFDEYFITQITLKNATFKTYMGITIGSTMQDVLNKYGQGEEVIEDGKIVLIYILKDMKMYFNIDDKQKVDNVILHIMPGVKSN